MFRAIIHFWHHLAASRDWTVYRVPDPDGFTAQARMRRWTGAGFEYRDCTEEETQDAYWHWAIK